MRLRVVGRRRALLIAACVASALLTGPRVAVAIFGDQVVIGSNTFTTATLQAPTSPTASARCDGTSPTIDIGWTATASSFADGYDVLRGTTAGGPYGSVTHVAGRTSVTHPDGGLTSSTTYYYVVRATANNWTSVYTAEVSATAPTC